MFEFDLSKTLLVLGRLEVVPTTNEHIDKREEEMTRRRTSR